MPPRKRLGQLLTELGVIDDHQLQSALGHQRQWGGKLGAVLVQKGFCGEEQLVSALAQHLNMARVKLAETKIDPRAVKLVSRQVAEKLHVFPYEVSGSGRSEVISIAMSDPTDLSAVDQLAFHTGKRIKPLLAADSEIIASIQAHYGPAEEKKEPTDKVARPAQGGPAPAGFPRRIEPQPASAAGAPSPRPAPAANPAVPAGFAAPMPEAPAAPAEKAEPAAAAPSPAAPAPAAPTPVELPEDDSEDLGLEPIAAHSQFGDAVAGQEDLAGNGSAADAIEGLVSASLAFQGAETAPAEAWSQAETPAAQQDAGWGTPLQATGEGWGTPAAEPAAAWPAPPSGEGWSMEEPSTSAGWSAPERDQAWTDVAGPPDGEVPSEALPTDAILGALEPSADSSDAGDTGWGAEEAAADTAAPAPAPDDAWQEEPAVAAPPPTFDAPAEADAAASAGPEAMGIEGAPEPAAASAGAGAFEEGAPGGEAPALEPETPSFDAAAALGDAPAPGPEAPAFDAAAAFGEAPAPEPEAPAFDAPAAFAEAPAPEAEAPALDAAPPEPAAPAQQAEFDAMTEGAGADFAPGEVETAAGPDTEPIAAPPAYAVAAEEHEAEVPDAWAASEDPLASGSGAEPGEAGESGLDARAPTEEFASPATGDQPGEGSAVAGAPPESAGGSESIEVDTASFEMTLSAEVSDLAPGSIGGLPDAGEPAPEADAGERQQLQASLPEEETGVPREPTERFAAQAEPDPGTWSAPAEEAGSRWIGEELEGATPLSPADLGTLASIGVEPSDGVGALRLLAALVRILNRSQVIEPDELRTEIRESRAAGAAAAADPAMGVETGASPPGSADPSETSAET